MTARILKQHADADAVLQIMGAAAHLVDAAQKIEESIDLGELLSAVELGLLATNQAAIATAPSERSPEQRRQANAAHRLHNIRAIAQAALNLVRTCETKREIPGHEAGAPCSGRNPNGGYCVCELGKDLERVERRQREAPAQSTEGGPTHGQEGSSNR